MVSLRDYQQAALDELRRGLAGGAQKQILCAPTGAGKTVIAAAMIEAAIAKGSRVAMIADRIVLVQQTSDRLHEAGIDHGIAQGLNTYGRGQRVQICSAQTLERRGFWPGLDMIIVDEAHTLRKKTIEMVELLGKPTIGLTATPFTKGLGKIYDRVVNASTTDELIKAGWLVPLRVFCATEIDMSGAPVAAGEWSDREVEKRAIPIRGDIVSEWVAHTHKVFGGPVKTLVFAPTVDYGEMLAEEFNSLGYRFEHVSYRSNSRGVERDQKIEDFRQGRIIGLISCEVLAKGFDVPDVLCGVSARPYRTSLAAHIQQLGRAMRSSEGKGFALWLDHAGNYLRHAQRTEAFWASGVSELDMGIKKERAGGGEKPDFQRKCKGCGYVMQPGAETCLMCGRAVPKRMPAQVVVPGKMMELGTILKKFPDLWRHLSRVAVNKHPENPERARRFAVAQYKNITGRWPRFGMELDPVDRASKAIKRMVFKNLQEWQKKQAGITTENSGEG